MKGKINRSGTLWIERAGTWVEQCCHNMCEQGLYNCTHECPRFGEPELVFGSYTPQVQLATGGTRLRLCHGTILTFDEFTDERLQP